MAYYPQMPNRQQPTYMAQPIPIVRPVTSLEEVKACPIDFDGSVFYFTDVANRRIYTKQVGMDGTAIINLYEQKQIAVPTITNSDNFVTKDEFETTIRQLIEKFSPEQTKPKEKDKKALFEI